MHKLSTIIVRNTDSLLMSSFIGLATVGLYSNYRLSLIHILRGQVGVLGGIQFHRNDPLSGAQLAQKGIVQIGRAHG